MEVISKLARSYASAAVCLNSVVRSIGWFCTDVSGLRIGPIFKVKMSKKIARVTKTPLKMGPIRSTETSVRNQPTLRNVPENCRI